jgi:F-type H+-transporting ATPase subunit delta
MAAGNKQVLQLARQFLKLSVVDGNLSADHVAGVLAYIEKNRPPQAVAILRAYHRLVAAEVARGQAVVEHAGAVPDTVLTRIGEAMTKRYGRRVTSIPRRQDSLIAGLRVRVGDDVYESSVAGQLATLTQAV